MTVTHKDVRQLREAMGLTTYQLADLLQVHEKTVRKWERDPRLFPKYAQRIPPLPYLVMQWMAGKGRPKAWPKPVKAGA